MACSGSCPKGFPQMQLSPLNGNSMRYPKLKSLSFPSPTSRLTLTEYPHLYVLRCSAAGHGPPSKQGTSGTGRSCSDHAHWLLIWCNADVQGGGDACRWERSTFGQVWERSAATKCFAIYPYEYIINMMFMATGKEFKLGVLLESWVNYLGY